MKRFRRFLWEVWLVAGLLTLWWVLSDDYEWAFYLPSLQTILVTFKETWFFTHVGDTLAPSMARFGLGFAIATVVGIPVGVALGLLPVLRRACDPFIDFMRALPKPAIIPIAMIIFGIGSTMQVFIIALGALWPILLNTIDGVRAAEPRMLDMARVYGISRGEQVRKIILPGASPQIFVGMRLSLATALILMVVSEMVGSTDGLGYFLLLSQRTFRFPEMWATIIMLGVIGYLVNLIFMLVERRLLAWHRGWRESALD